MTEEITTGVPWHLPYFAALIAMTLTEILMASYFHSGRIPYVLVLVPLALMKVTILCGWFMGLRFDRPLFAWMLAGPAVLGAGFIAATALLETWGSLG